jgi:hypothetical protein
MMNQFRSFMQANPAPQPRPMMPTMGSAIRGMFGGPRPSGMVGTISTARGGPGAGLGGIAARSPMPRSIGDIAGMGGTRPISGGATPILRGLFGR